MLYEVVSTDYKTMAFKIPISQDVSVQLEWTKIFFITISKRLLTWNTNCWYFLFNNRWLLFQYLCSIFVLKIFFIFVSASSRQSFAYYNIMAVRFLYKTDTKSNLLTRLNFSHRNPKVKHKVCTLPLHDCMLISYF